MKKKMILIFTTTLFLVIMLSACTSQDPSDSSGAQDSNTPAAPNGDVEAPAEQNSDPVVLKLYPGQWIIDEDLELLINEPLQKKYPHISVERIDRNENPLEEYIMSNGQLDLITTWNGSMANWQELELFEDLLPLINQSGIELERFDQGSVDTILAIPDNGQLYGLPYNRQYNALYYNKEIFDRFGVNYPEDGMTWDETIELATKLTRVDDGVAYRGLDPENVTRVMFQLGLNVVDAATDKADVNSDSYRKLFETVNRIYAIPGNKPPEWGYSAYNAFVKDRNVAMSAMVNLTNTIVEHGEGLDWDIAQYPSFEDNPDVYGMYDMHILSITKNSKHKDDALKVLEVLFSDEVQMDAVTKTGRISLLNDSKFQEAYGSENPVLQGKHLEAIFMSTPAHAPRFSKHYSKASGILRDHFYQYADGNKDVNEALRDAEEEINQYIEANSN